MSKYVKVDDVMAFINTSNRGNCDYFIVDKIEELCKSNKVYDVEKVVEELETKENEWWDTYSLSSGFDEYAHGKSVGFEEAIDIVKAGGLSWCRKTKRK